MKFAPIMIGFIAGVAVSAIAFKVMEHRNKPTLDAAKARATAAEQAAIAAGKSESATLAELKRTTVEIEVLRAENRAMAAQAAPPPGQDRPPRRPLRSLAPEMARLAARLRGCTWDNWPKEARDLQSQIMAEINELARELGISPEEAMRSPDGLTRLLVEALANSNPPLDAGQESRLRELLTLEKPAWDEWKAARPSMTALESRRKFLDVAGKTRDAFLAALTDGQRIQVRDFGVLDAQIQGSQTWFDGSRATVTAALATQWTSTLNLNDDQSLSLVPVVQDYIKQSRELNESIWARRRAGEDLSREKDYAMRLDLMIQTHKRIMEAARLTGEQLQAMKEWQFTYGVNITDAAGD